MMGYGNWGMWFIPLMAWTAFWKGMALWKSARSGEKYWFIALVVINTMGLLEIAYLFLFAKDKMTVQEVQSTVTGKATKTKKSKK